MSHAANLLQIDSKFLKNIEDGIKTESPLKFKIIKAASEIYDVSVDYLFGGTDDWELSEDAKAKREINLYLYSNTMREFYETQLLPQVMFKTLSIAVEELLTEVGEINNALCVFEKRNKTFDVMPGYSSLQYRIGNAIERAKEVRCKLKRCDSITLLDSNTKND